nr:sulfatase-like hydrolase/transferase [Myxococcota bacterium]
YVDAYDEEIAYTDAEIGRLLASYGPRLDDALVIFTADHGETMIEHDMWFTHGFQVYDAIVRVPLLVRGPGVSPGRSAGPAHGTDAAPTFLHAAGAPVPESMPNVDLRTGAGLRPDRKITVEATAGTGQWRAVIQGEAKAMVNVKGPGREVRERRSYDLASDPNETEPARWQSENEASRALIELVRSDPDASGVPSQYEKGMQLRAPKVAPRVDPETLEALEQLGYAE